MNILLIMFVIFTFSYLIIQVYVTKRVLLRTNVQVSLISAAVMSVFIFISFMRAMFQNWHNRGKIIKLIKLFLFGYPVLVLIFGELISYEASKRKTNSITINVNVKIPKVVNFSAIVNIFKNKKEVYQNMVTDIEA